MTTPIEVESPAGSEADEEPCAFRVEGVRRGVVEIVNRWHEPDAHYYKVRADDGREYLLQHDHPSDEWRLLAVSPTHG